MNDQTMMTPNEALLCAACDKYHDAVDRLFARLIALDDNFFPTKTKEWEAVVFGRDAVIRVRGK